MKSKVTILPVISVAIVLSGCHGTRWSATSRDHREILSSEYIDFKVHDFTAWKRGAGYFEMRGDLLLGEADYGDGFELEIEKAAAPCAAFANSDIAFTHDWWALKVTVFIRYEGERGHGLLGGRYYTSSTEVFISRGAMLELRQRGASPSEYPQHWELSAHKCGPPDCVPPKYVPTYLKSEGVWFVPF